MDNTKAILRDTYKEKRLTLSSKERLKLDDLLLLQFQQINFAGIHTLLTYWPMAAMAEPNTHLFSSYLRHMIPSLTMAYPRIKNKVQMEAVIIDEDTVYDTNTWGVTEPRGEQVLDPHKIDLVLTPLLIFDTNGYRVGYGKGFYDRFLSDCSQAAIIGFSYFEPVTEITDTHEFDLPLTIGITPDKLYEF
ncbi:MAG: hypothetical protein RL596_395 [Bacteroidota bacterium]|jgi:5-formyltetrahydrofolate cyclo-ligase